MKRRKLEIQVFEQQPLAQYYFNWDSVLREEFEQKSDGCWQSATVFEADDPNDKIALGMLERYTERLLHKHKIVFKSKRVEYGE